tara:strand:- start:514 stop:1602 length:1089 start_codon:yes stop_codon:yes gene_type:complete
MSCILVVGGCGYIGSHTCITLLENGNDLIILDNFSNSSISVVNRIGEILGFPENILKSRINVIEGDIRDGEILKRIFIEQLKKNKPIEIVFHFAGLKSVEESIIYPKKYWDVNVNGSRNLISVMEKYKCKTLIFSSSATIYGDSKLSYISEEAEIRPINPYGETKVAIENMLFELAGCTNSNSSIKIPSPNGWRIARLRYFNPVGSHKSSLIGESALKPNNLFPIISAVATGGLNTLKIFGNDWPTPDGTAIRDYIHVIDLAEGHYCALQYLLRSNPHLLTLNLGTGKGTSVLNAVKTFEKVSKKDINYQIVGRRKGDSARIVADVKMANKYLNWQAKRNLEEMCFSSFKWKLNNLNNQDII